MIYIFTGNLVGFELRTNLARHKVAERRVRAFDSRSRLGMQEFANAIALDKPSPRTVVLVNQTLGSNDELNGIAQGLHDRGFKVARYYECGSGYEDESRPWAARFVAQRDSVRDIAKTLRSLASNR